MPKLLWALVKKGEEKWNINKHMIKYLQNGFIGNRLVKKFLAIFIILGIIFFIGFCVVTNVKNAPKILPNGEVEYDFMKQSQPKASKILYEYMLKDLGKTPKEAEEFKIYPKLVRAFEYDLNDDGQKEIIGYVVSPAYWGTAGYSLFILEKHNKSYIDVAYLINFEPLEKVHILKTYTNGYKNIKIHGSSAYNFKPMILTYNGKVYFNLEQIRLFEKYMRDFQDYDVSEITGDESWYVQT